MSNPILQIDAVSKVYPSGLRALDGVSLEIQRGEIFALLGPNGAGKTTLISIICGIANASSGRILVDGRDIKRDFRHARSTIGLVPQELATDAFESVWATVCFSRGLFGKAPDPAHLERVLRSLSLWDKRDSRIMALSGGMKRRVLIAKALAHEPKLLFLDEPTAGVDVELRKEMWELVRQMQQQGVTIILTTHYIEEAESMADRIGVINNGKLVLVEEKTRLLQSLGKKQLILDLQQPLAAIPAGLEEYSLNLNGEGTQLIFDFNVQAEQTGIAQLLRKLDQAQIQVKDLQTRQSSLEDIFVGLVHKEPQA